MSWLKEDEEVCIKLFYAQCMEHLSTAQEIQTFAKPYNFLKATCLLLPYTQ